MARSKRGATPFFKNNFSLLNKSNALAGLSFKAIEWCLTLVLSGLLPNWEFYISKFFNERKCSILASVAQTRFFFWASRVGKDLVQHSTDPCRNSVQISLHKSNDFSIEWSIIIYIYYVNLLWFYLLDLQPQITRFFFELLL